MVIANSHVDIVAWRTSRAFVGLEQAIEQVLAHLRARRTGVVDGAEPTGLMTHHLFHDPACWQFCRDMLCATKEHPAVVWLSSREVFVPGLPVSGRSA